MNMPPIVQKPTPLITFGDIKTVLLAAISFFLWRFIRGISGVLSAPYKWMVSLTTTIGKVPLVGKVLAGLLSPIKVFFGSFAKIGIALTTFFKIAFVVFIILIIVKVVAKIVSRVTYKKNLKKCEEFYSALNNKLNTAVSVANKMAKQVQSLKDRKTNQVESNQDNVESSGGKLRNMDLY